MPMQNGESGFPHVVRVTRLRRLGRKLKSSIAEAEQQYLGEVTDHWRNATQVLTMSRGLPSDSKLILPPDLYNPVIAQMGGRKLRLRGIESVDDAGYVQEWMIEFL